MSDQLIRGFWQSRRTSAGLVERRALEPICTALLTRNDKLALQNCQKALRARPYNPPVQALFAISLVRQGQLEDALAVAEEVSQDVKGAGKALSDSSTLQLISWVFEQKSRNKEALQMWERATKKHPAHLDLIFDAASHFMRIGAFEALEEVCKATVDAKHESHKAYPQAYEHLVWSYIVAVVIQVGDLANPRAKARISSSSTQRSLESVYKGLQDCLTYFNAGALTPVKATAPQKSTDADPSICTNPHTFYLLLKVLKYLAEAPENIRVDSKSAKLQLISVLNTPQGLEYCQKDLTIDLFRREALLQFGNSQDWANLWTIMAKKLDDGDPNWATILTAIQAAYGCATGSTSVPTNTTEVNEAVKVALPSSWWEGTTIEQSKDSDRVDGIKILRDTKSKLEKLGEDQGFSKKDRGLTLGLLKLASWFPSQPHAALPDLVILYLQRHANKACCFSDLRDYLTLLDEDGRQKVRSWLDATYGTGDINVDSLVSMECSITAEKVGRYLQGRYGTAEEELQRGHRLVKAYCAAIHFGQNLIATDLQPNDELALLAAQCYLGAWEQSQKTSQHLELAIAILKFAIRRSKYRFQIRVLLIRLYQIAGAPSLVLKHYKLMDTKQIQHDTLAHWALERGTTFFASPDVGNKGTPILVDGEIVSFPHTLESISSWYHKADEETTYSVSQAWASNTYYLLEDYTAFQDRLTCSLSRKAISLEHIRTMTLTAPLAAKTDVIRQLLDTMGQKGSELNDNRDYSILPDHQPFEQDSVLKQTQLAPRTDSTWAKHLADLYVAFIDGTTTLAAVMSETPDPASMTAHETKMLQWAGPVLQWLSDKDAKVADAKALQFLKDCHADLMQSTINQSLWPIYHIAQVALEAYCLLDAAFTAKSSNPGDFKGIKQFKQIRQDSKGSMKAISSRLKALNEDLSRKYKARNKLEALLPLKQFEQVSEDFLFDVATQLLDSRKSGLFQLANAITKRTAGP